MAEQNTTPAIRLRLPCASESEFHARFAKKLASSFFVAQDIEVERDERVRVHVTLGNTDLFLKGEGTAKPVTQRGKKGVAITLTRLDAEGLQIDLDADREDTPIPVRTSPALIRRSELAARAAESKRPVTPLGRPPTDGGFSEAIPTVESPLPEQVAAQLQALRGRAATRPGVEPGAGDGVEDDNAATTELERSPRPEDNLPTRPEPALAEAAARASAEASPPAPVAPPTPVSAEASPTAPPESAATGDAAPSHTEDAGETEAPATSPRADSPVGPVGVDARAPSGPVPVDPPSPPAVSPGVAERLATPPVSSRPATLPPPVAPAADGSKSRVLVIGIVITVAAAVAAVAIVMLSDSDSQATASPPAVAVDAAAATPSEPKPDPDITRRVTELLELANARIASGELAGPGSALEHLLAARELAPESEAVTRHLQALADTFDKLAQAAEAAGNRTEAATHLRAALKAQPEREGLAERLRAVEPPEPEP